MSIITQDQCWILIVGVAGSGSVGLHCKLHLHALHSGELRHRTCHFYARYTGISKINSVYGNLRDQMKLDLCIHEALKHSTMDTVFVGMAIN